MRSNLHDYSVIAPPTLSQALELLAADPGLTPIAGGTELMVALSTGRLPHRQLLSLHQVRELRFIHANPETIVLGAGTTFTETRQHEAISEDLPLLTAAASWTGSIANQNRGTLGGNIVNASPAADTPPALLAYGATVTLISSAGMRTIPYGMFHLGYKKTALAPGELLYSVAVPRRWPRYRSYIRKVGTRKAQAIAKVAIAALARIEDGVIADIRIGAASLRETPARCTGVEEALTGKSISAASLSSLIAEARAALEHEAKPIDDIRSTARYRAAVAANLIGEFLEQLGRAGG